MKNFKNNSDKFEQDIYEEQALDSFRKDLPNIEGTTDKRMDSEENLNESSEKFIRGENYHNIKKEIIFSFTKCIFSELCRK
jgi:hypothetical protein